MTERERKTLREWRESQYMTLAELANLMGVTTRTVWTWEHGTEPRFSNRRQLAHVLNIEPSQLVFEAIAPKARAA